MPTLRFSRDRRGYESTYLLHTSKRRPGAEPSQLLYWFRTPPHIKIGRAAFDEDAIRMLEEQHPDVEFEWDRILTTKAPAVPEPRDPREARPARRPDRRPVRESRRDQPRALLPEKPAPTAAMPIEHSEDVTHYAIDAAPSTPSVPAGEVAPPPMETPIASPEPPPAAAEVTSGAQARRFVRVFDAPASDAAAPEHHATEPSVAERMLGAEQLTVLRARHAEILARISSRGGDPARLEALREQASSVDPDTWVTESEVTAGLAAVDSTLAELHRIVGRRRRRRRRRRDGAPQQGMAPGVQGGEAATRPDEVDDHDEPGADPADDGTEEE